MDQIVKDYYIHQLNKEKAELDYITKGVVVEADKLIHDYEEDTAKTPLTLDAVCALADDLNAMLDVVYTKQKSVELAEKSLNDYLTKNGEAADDNHE